METILLIIFAFLIGSIPSGVIIARVKGIDLKKSGSGNIGATNVLRTMGKGPAVLTLMGDVMKGMLAVVAGEYFAEGPLIEGVLGLSAIIGHDFSIFLRFKGGKGVATSIGALLVYSPKAALATVLIWLATIAITRYSSMGAIVSFGVLPGSIYFLDYTREKLIISVLITTLLLLRHAANIIRLAKGEEPKIGERK